MDSLKRKLQKKIVPRTIAMDEESFLALNKIPRGFRSAVIRQFLLQFEQLLETYSISQLRDFSIIPGNFHETEDETEDIVEKGVEDDSTTTEQ